MKYNEMKIIKGIYSITNIKTGNTYIGISKDIYTRWSKHINDLKNNNHHQHKLQEEFNKYSIDDFDFKIIEVFNNYQEHIVKQLEDEYILELRDKALGFEQLTNREIGCNYIVSNLSKGKKVKSDADKIIESFIKIPKKLILNKEFLENHSDKFICIFTLLILSEDKQGYIKFTLEDLIITAGSKPKWGKDRINNQVKDIIKLMIQEGLLECDVDVSKITMNGLIKGKIHIPYEFNNIGKSINWVKVNISDYSKILDSKTKLSKFTMTNIYFYILSRVIRRSEGSNCGAEIFWCSQEEMCDVLGITRQTLNTYLKLLNNLGLIYYGSIGKLVKDNVVMNPHNVYATNEQELKYGLKQSKYYWENQGWKVINKKS